LKELTTYGGAHTLKWLIIHANITKQQITNWGNQDNVMSRWSNVGKTVGVRRSRKPGGGRHMVCPEMEMAVMRWIVISRAVGKPLSNLAIQMKAVEYTKLHGIDNFKASNTWVRSYVLSSFALVYYMTMTSISAMTTFDVTFASLLTVRK